MVTIYLIFTSICLFLLAPFKRGLLICNYYAEAARCVQFCVIMLICIVNLILIVNPKFSLQSSLVLLAPTPHISRTTQPPKSLIQLSQSIMRVLNHRHIVIYLTVVTGCCQICFQIIQFENNPSPSLYQIYKVYL